MRPEREWIAWCDEHPRLAGVMQLGIYALCWLGFFAVVVVVAALLGWLVEIL